MSALLDELGLGWAQPVHGAQQAFRVLLAAMSHPGRIHALPAAAMAGVEAPATADGRPMSMAATVSLLTLLDAESSVHFAGPTPASPLAAYFRFHCGVPSAVLAQARFAHAPAGLADAALCEAMPHGSDAEPQDGATLVLEVDGLDAGAAAAPAQTLRLRGPGVRTETLLSVRGGHPDLWRWRAARARAFPRGIDLLLCCGAALAAIPRSTLLSLEAPCM